MIYKKSPLPFQGQKVGWFEDFQTMLESFPDCTTIIDVFGGSGLLAHWARRLRPDARVIWNDFDNFRERLSHLAETNELKTKISALSKEIRNKKKIPQEVVMSIKQILRSHAGKFGYLDCKTVSSWILFSGTYFKSLKEFEEEKKFYRCLISSAPYPTPDAYLNGLTIVREDWRVFFTDPVYDTDRTLYLLDRLISLRTDTATREL